jgi:hypothetical protein
VKEDAKVAAYYKGKSVAEQVTAFGIGGLLLSGRFVQPLTSSIHPHRIRWI